MTRRTVLILAFLFVISFGSRNSNGADNNNFPRDARRILFLGDSITHAGGYVAWVETQLRLQGVDPLPEIINIGLASETASGLSEPAHPFPRPDVHERLDRALAKLQPDVVVACYGMNDGIYYPLSEERFAAYRAGINRLIEKAQTAGAKVILVTPPPFDPLPLRDSGKLKPAGENEYAYTSMYENYNDVLTVYAKWIMQQADRVAMVIDINTPLTEYTTEQRKTNPQFTHAGDGIHPGAEGHRVIGEAILRAWGIPQSIPPSEELLKLVSARTALLHDAYLTEVGHQRPGVGKGMPLAEAREKASKLDAKIEQLMKNSEDGDSCEEPETESSEAATVPDPTALVPADKIPKYTAARTAQPLQIDGKLDEPAWKSATRTSSFVDLISGEKTHRETRSAILWDDKYLYIGFWIAEPNVDAKYTNRDDPIYYDNDVEVFIAGADAYYEFEINALGTIYEGLFIWEDAYQAGGYAADPQLRRGVAKSQAFDGVGLKNHPRGKRIAFLGYDFPGLRWAVHIDGTLNDSSDTDKGWTVELAFPWKSMNWLAQGDNRSLPPKPGDQWKIDLFRFNKYKAPAPAEDSGGWALGKHGVWDSHVPEIFPVVTFADESN